VLHMIPSSVLFSLALVLVSSSWAFTKISVGKQLSIKFDIAYGGFSRLEAVPPNRQIGNEKGEVNPFLGFTSKAELINGRIAMTLFAVGIYEEFITGKSILEQVGLEDQSEQLSALELAAVFGTLALVPAFQKTLTRLTNKEI
jgi:hypothetical protein